MALLIEAGQMTASDYVPIYPDLPLASEGASTDAILKFRPERQVLPRADIQRVSERLATAAATVPEADW
jgi:hypothetical protein